MIQKLRRKFVAAAMTSLTAVLLILLGAVNIVSYYSTVSNADALLHLLSENQGTFPMKMFVNSDHAGRRQDDDTIRDEKESDISGEEVTDLERRFSPETPYETRFFTVVLENTNEIRLTDVSSIAAIDEETAENYARDVLAGGKSSGFLKDYRYLVSEQDGMTRVIFLDCGRSLNGVRVTLLASVGISVGGLLLVFALLTLISEKIVRPLAESHEKQRQFITDAGHEIKTPLTIINADADLLELELGENEWLSDIRRQAQRLTDLTKDLIYLSRMDEDRPSVQFVPFPLSDVVEETAASFQGPASMQGKQLEVSVEPMLSLDGSEKDIRQLISILLDNALKYSPAQSRIRLELKAGNRSLLLSVTNTVSEPIAPDKLPHLFDRFYRVETSHSSSTGGYGLGLAIAHGIVSAHHGKIRAESPSEHILTITAVFSMPSGKE